MANRKDEIAEVVRKMASLARLRFDEASSARFAQKAEAVLDYVEQLAELDTEDIDPTSHAADLTTPLRDDEAIDSGLQEAILDNSPERDDGYVQVPKVLEGE